MTNIEKFVRTFKWFSHAWGKHPEMGFMEFVEYIHMSYDMNLDLYNDKDLLKILKEFYESGD